MLEAIADFFPERHRKLVQALAAKTSKLTDLGVAKALEKIADPALETRMLAKFETDLDQAIEKMLTPSDSATASPASSE